VSLEVEDLLGVIERLARALMGGDPAHGWPHVERVRSLAWRIVEEEGLSPDRLTLELAVLLHDTGRSVEGRGHHAEKSASLARDLLAVAGLDPARIEAVVHAILAHSYSLGVPARTVEAKILSDADKLDALGAVGIARVVHTGCQMGRSFEESLDHIYEKILRLPSLLHYEASRRIAEERLEIVRRFAEELAAELGENVKPPRGPP